MSNGGLPLITLLTLKLCRSVTCGSSDTCEVCDALRWRACWVCWR